MPSDPSETLNAAATIVTAYVSRNVLPASELPDLIGSVSAALDQLGGVEPEPAPEPAVPLKKALKPDAITCLDCGESFTSLKRHLRTRHDLSPTEYRQRWGLAPDYPMAAPDYSRRRSQLAYESGLGRKKR